MENKLVGKSISERKCRNYLQIKNSENKTVSVNDILLQSKGSISHEFLKRYTYIYRGDELSYEQLSQNKAFELKIAEMYHNPEMLKKEILKCFEVKSGFIIRLIESLERYINKARFETINASNKFNVDYLNSDINYHDYDFYYQQRCYNAENAIYSYYAAFEILMQIIWIYKGFHGDTYNFKKALKSYSTPQILIKKLNDCADKEFVNLVSKDTKDIKPEYSKVRIWCNKFKHRGILEFDGNDISNKPTFNIIFTEEHKEQQGVKDFGSKNMQYEYIDLDNDVMPELISYHNNFLDLCNKTLAGLEI
ncbi:MAG: hypothetical protein GX663_01155 [Clostridiales bacterium]|nr:hypothetical protein [Clostridiales bacterium]